MPLANNDADAPESRRPARGSCAAGAGDARRHGADAPTRSRQLIIKTLYTGEMSGLQLADSLRLPYPILEPIIERARGERQIEVRGAAGAGTRRAISTR